MINLSNQVPSIYTKASRDFQYLGWLTDIVLNSVKHNVDGLYNLPLVADNTRLTELLAMTLGFKIKRNYDNKQLSALVSVLPSILKYKGTEKSIVVAAEALIKASGAAGSLDYSIDNAQLNITFPKELVDTTLFMDLLDYILPAGMSCRIIRNTQTKRYLDNVLVGFKDTVRFGNYKDLGFNDTLDSVGLSMLFDASKPTSDFASNLIQSDDTSDEFTLNAGLMSNTVLPVLSATSPSVDSDTPLYPNMVDYNGKILVSSDGLVLFAKEPEETLPDVGLTSNMYDADGMLLISSDYLVLYGKEPADEEPNELGDEIR